VFPSAATLATETVLRCGAPPDDGQPQSSRKWTCNPRDVCKGPQYALEIVCILRKLSKESYSLGEFL